MGMSVKNRIRFNRRRLDIRRYLSIKNAIILTSVIGTVLICTSVIGGIVLEKKVKNSTVLYKANKDEMIENYDALKDIDDKKDNKKNNEVNDNKKTNEDENKKDDENVVKEDSNIDNKINENINSDMNIALLGEMMMGGVVTKNLNYSYSNAFKDVYTDINTADFTYCNFSTNITNLDKIEDAKSKYLVNKDIGSAFKALGLDSVSIASDHIIDFPKEIIKNTIDILEKNDIFVAGRQNMPVYFEKGNKKIAIVSTNSVIRGTAKNYTKNDISVYTKDNLAKNIKEAKESADIVIADIHWGREFEYGVTDQMRNIAKNAIDSGADMVIGTNAVGVYPIVTYKNKPIIYSLGYLIGDSDLFVAKEGFIFNINISKDKKIDKITMKPIYINNKKEVLKYQDYDKDKSNEVIERFNKWHLENGLNSKIVDNNIEISF